jgi:hypothetical protein
VGRGTTSLCLSVNNVNAYVTNRRSCTLDPKEDDVCLYAGRRIDPVLLSVALLQFSLMDDLKSLTQMKNVSRHFAGTVRLQTDLQSHAISMFTDSSKQASHLVFLQSPHQLNPSSAASSNKTTSKQRS